MKPLKTILLIVVAFGLWACSGDDDTSHLSETAGEIPGFGNAGGAPQGGVYELPEKVGLVTEIRGGYCDTDEGVYGSGGTVTVCVCFHNDGDEDIEFVLPAGLVWIPGDVEGYQKGMLLQGVRIFIPAGEERCYTLLTYCANASKSASSSSMAYGMGPVTNSVLVNELIDLVKGKKINTEDYEDEEGYYRAIWVLQSALWAITDGEGLTEYHRDEIREIPDM